MADQIRKMLRLAAAAIGFVLYVWYTAVRHTPGVKQRKAERRRRRLIERES